MENISKDYLYHYQLDSLLLSDKGISFDGDRYIYLGRGQSIFPNTNYDSDVRRLSV